MECVFGIKFIRYVMKKFVGDVDDVVVYFFLCDSVKKLIFVGDRYFTDVVYGNRYGMFIVRVVLFIIKGELFVIKSVRKIEEFVVVLWCLFGVVLKFYELLFSGGVFSDVDGKFYWIFIDGELVLENFKCVFL